MANTRFQQYVVSDKSPVFSIQKDKTATKVGNVNIGEKFTGSLRLVPISSSPKKEFTNL